MKSELFINRCVTLHNKNVCLNGNSVFEPEKGLPMKEFLVEWYKNTGISYPKFHKMDNLSKTGFLGCELLLNDVVIDDNLNTGIYFTNRSSSLDTDFSFQTTIGPDYFPSPSLFVYTLPNIVIGEICIRHKLFGENTFFSDSQYNPDRYLAFLNESFNELKMSQAIIGWIECFEEKAELLLLLVETKNRTGNIFNIETINKICNGKVNNKT